MFHQVDALLNSSGDALVGYFVKAKDSEGSYATLYADENETPIASLSGVADAAKTDDVGMFDFYIADGTYDLEFFDKNDTSLLVKRIPAVPMYSNTNAEAAKAATLADLASTTAGKGASLVSFESGETVQDLASTDAGKGAALVGFKQAGTATVAVTTEDTNKRIFHATDLGAAADGTGDDGAILSAAIESRFGNIGITNQSEEPVTIEFGDSRYVYNLETPIVVTQNNVRLIGNGAKLVGDGTDSAFVASGIGTSNVLYGVHIVGFVLHGTFTGDAIDLSGGNSMFVADILNYADVTGAIVKLASVSSSATDHIRHPAGFGGVQIGSHAYLIHETTVETSPGTYANCIANNHTNLLSYYATASGVLLDESNGCTVHGDFEVANGPGVDILNSVGCRVSGHFEKNGQTATNTGTDTPDDIRIRSDAGGEIITRATRNVVHNVMAGAELVGGVTPHNVHIVSADTCMVVQNDFAGKVTVESGCELNVIGRNVRVASGIYNNDTSTILVPVPNQGGFVDITGSTTTAAITFATTEVNEAYQVNFGAVTVSGTPATGSKRVSLASFPTTTGFTLAVEAGPGVGNTVRLWWQTYRVPE